MRRYLTIEVKYTDGGIRHLGVDVRESEFCPVGKVFVMWNFPTGWLPSLMVISHVPIPDGIVLDAIASFLEDAERGKVPNGHPWIKKYTAPDEQTVLFGLPVEVSDKGNLRHRLDDEFGDTNPRISSFTEPEV